MPASSVASHQPAKHWNGGGNGDSNGYGGSGNNAAQSQGWNGDGNWNGGGNWNGNGGNNWNNNCNWNNNWNNNCWGNNWNNCGWNNWCGPSYYSPWCGPSYWGGSGFSFGVGYNSWSGWNFGFGFGFSSGAWSGWGGWGASCYTPYYSSVYYAPAYVPYYTYYPYYSPAYVPWTPVYVAPTYYTPFYSYSSTVVVPNYVEVDRVVYEPAPNILILDSDANASAGVQSVVVGGGANGGTAYVLPTSQSMAAWGALNSGDTARALDQFRDLLFLNPTDARALVGQGIAAMLLEQDGQATASFRLAIGTDTSCMSQLPISSALAQRIGEQAERLWSVPESDAAFVSAVGYTLIGQPQLAFRVASRAIELGDASLTTAQLRNQLAYSMGSGD